MITTSHISSVALSAAIFAALTSVAFAQEARFTLGPATTTNPGLLDCGAGSRISAVGAITSEDGQVWTVPAATSFEIGPKAPDLYNDCGGNVH
ncbi:MAG: hypothetical protein ACRC6I_01805, partial [Paracoccaceae bacterium]